MTYSCPLPPDMDDCKSRKKRCLSGPCVGSTYTEGEECEPGSVFHPDTCQCEQNNPTGVYLVTIEASGPTLEDPGPHYTYYEIDDDFIDNEGRVVSWAIGFANNPNGRFCQQQSECGREPCGDLSGIVWWSSECGDGGLRSWQNPDMGPCTTPGADYFRPWYIPASHSEGLCTAVCDRTPDYGGIIPNFRIMRTYHDGTNYNSTSSGWALTPSFDRIKCRSGVTDGPAVYSTTIEYIGPGRLCDYYSGMGCNTDLWRTTTLLTPK